MLCLSQKEGKSSKRKDFENKNIEENLRWR